MIWVFGNQAVLWQLSLPTSVSCGKARCRIGFEKSGMANPQPVILVNLELNNIRGFTNSSD
jgi:hypothetical protein